MNFFGICVQIGTKYSMIRNVSLLLHTHTVVVSVQRG